MPDKDNSPQRMFSDLAQIGVVVRDLDKTMRELSEIFGLGPFRTTAYPPAHRGDMHRIYRGRPGDFRYRQAFTEVGTIELELIQPLEGESIWADFLREHGEGIHHIRFNVPDLEPVIEHLSQHGIDVIMKGSGLRPGTTWANFGTESQVGFTIEVMNALPGTNGRTPQDL
ncbi:MAG: VOC family protein [Chloroflexi bacterium]|nr:VOC family protein [Chloroflexota bacterium]